MTEKLSDIFGEKKDPEKMKRKRKWWKRFSDEVSKMVGPNDILSNILLKQIPEKTATIEISDDKKRHPHTSGSWREKTQVRNNIVKTNVIDIETAAHTDDIETAVHTDMIDVHLKETKTDMVKIKHTNTPPHSPKNVFNLSLINNLETTSEPDDQSEVDPRDDGEGVMNDKKTVIVMNPTRFDPTLRCISTNAVQEPEISLLFPNKSENKTKNQQNNKNEQQRETKTNKKQQHDVKIEQQCERTDNLSLRLKFSSIERNRQTNEPTDYSELGARPKVKKILPGKTVENLPKVYKLEQKNPRKINENHEGGGACPFSSPRKYINIYKCADK